MMLVTLNSSVFILPAVVFLTLKDWNFISTNVTITVQIRLKRFCGHNTFLKMFSQVVSAF